VNLSIDEKNLLPLKKVAVLSDEDVAEVYSRWCVVDCSKAQRKAKLSVCRNGDDCNALVKRYNGK
jgi:hypothetical protein